MQLDCKYKAIQLPNATLLRFFFIVMKTTRNTVARKKIEALFAQTPIALSQPDIQQSLQGQCDRVTIYRILERLLNEGIIHKIVNVNGTVNYAVCHHCSTTHQHQHIHFSCRECKEVKCLEQVIPAFQLPSGFQEEETYFTISGVCNNCSAKSPITDQ
jgi:Fur family ferric uptake transcriptional regulator